MDQKKRRVVALVQHKGGVGKTTATLGFAQIASEGGRPATVVDLDRQRLASRMIELYQLRLRCVTDLADASDAELVFVDTPGLQAQETARAIKAADLIVVPLRASVLDWLGASHVVEALREWDDKVVVWLPSQLDARRTNDRELAAEIQAAAAAGKVPNWPILPGIRSLASVSTLLQGDLRGPAAECFRDNYKRLRRFL